MCKGDHKYFVEWHGFDWPFEFSYTTYVEAKRYVNGIRRWHGRKPINPKLNTFYAVLAIASPKRVRITRVCNDGKTQS